MRHLSLCLLFTCSASGLFADYLQIQTKEDSIVVLATELHPKRREGSVAIERHLEGLTLTAKLNKEGVFLLFQQDKGKKLVHRTSVPLGTPFTLPKEVTDTLTGRNPNSKELVAFTASITDAAPTISPKINPAKLAGLKAKVAVLNKTGLTIKEITKVKDGGTLRVETSKGDFYIDQRLGSFTKGKVFIGLPTQGRFATNLEVQQLMGALKETAAPNAVQAITAIQPNN